MATKNKGGGARKYGRNKKSPSMMAYKASNRIEKNKKRKARRVEREWEKKLAKMLDRIHAGKPVHYRWKLRFADEIGFGVNRF